MTAKGRIPVSDSGDLKQKLKKDLVDKGVEASTADYLSDLFADSEKGRQIVNDGELVPVGNCFQLGLVPG